MRFIKLLILAIVLVTIVVIAVANREMVTAQLLPEPLANVLNYNQQVTLPLFGIILISMLVGLLLGYLFEWLRERKHRRAVVVKDRELSKLESEVATLRKKTGDGEDDVLALLN